jgi:hypothetical protein
MQTQIVGNLLIRGSDQKATVERRIPHALLEEFDNQKSEPETIKEQPSAFFRALKWAQENQQ